jgi:peptide/nickel transport system permease protein
MQTRHYSNTTAGQKLAPRIAARWRAFIDSDFLWLFWKSKSAVIAFTCCMLILLCSLFSHWIAPHNVFDTAGFDLMDSELPPAWMSGGDPRFWLGTDVQGRDILSLMLYGLNISLIIGGLSVLASVAIGVGLGVLSGYFGGIVDTLIMRFADAMLSIPTIMFTLLVSGVARVAIPKEYIGHFAPAILIGAIALTGWMQYARTVRGLTLLEKGREYVMASQISGGSHLHIMLAHIVPNVMRPVLVMATLHLVSRFSPKPPCHFSASECLQTSLRWEHLLMKAISTSFPGNGGSFCSRPRCWSYFRWRLTFSATGCSTRSTLSCAKEER